MAQLDHVNIQTTRLAETVQFYADVLGLEARDPPEMDASRVQWMHGADGRAIFHLTMPGTMLGESEEDARGAGTGAVHHVALDCEGHDAMVARLQALGLEHRLNHVRSIDLKQIFVTDPNGVLIELNYRAGNH